MRPIFIGGCDRSGTTMLGAMLGGHPAHLPVPEFQAKIPILTAANPDGMVDVLSLMNLVGSSGRFWRLWGVEVDHDLPAKLPARSLVEHLVRVYGTSIDKPKPAVWIDHTPSNTRYAQALSTYFPDAHIIHLIRDGRAVAASIMKEDWGPNQIDTAARFWLARIAHGLAAESASGLVPVTRIRYEDIIERPAVSLQALCSEIGIEYAPQMVEETGIKPNKYLASTHGLVGLRPEQTRISAWQEDLTPRQIEIFESIANDTLGYLGYSVKYGLGARVPSSRETWSSNCRELFQRRVNRIRRLRRRLKSLSLSWTIRHVRHLYYRRKLLDSMNANTPE